HTRGSAVAHNQQPPNEIRQSCIHQDHPLIALILPIGPPDHRVPEEVDATNQAQNSQHVLAGRSSAKRDVTRPIIVLSRKVRKIFDEYDGEWNCEVAKTSK